MFKHWIQLELLFGYEYKWEEVARMQITILVRCKLLNILQIFDFLYKIA